MAKFGGYIRRKRKKLFWTQQDLALKVGVTVRQVNTWERTVEDPNSIYATNLRAIAGAFGIDVNAMIAEADAPIELELADVEEWFQALSEKEQHNVLNRLSSMVTPPKVDPMSDVVATAEILRKIAASVPLTREEVLQLEHRLQATARAG